MSALRQVLLIALLVSGCGAVGCTATQRKEAKTVVCHVCDSVASYCQDGVPLTEAQKQEIVKELYPDAGAPDAH